MAGRLGDVTGEGWLKEYRRQIEPRLEVLLTPAERQPESLHAAMNYAVLGGGKRLRPALCMASAVAASGVPSDGIDVGCSAEFVHCFSLIHDDLPAIDDDEMRRGRLTVHRKFNEAIAVLAGDALFALAFEVLGRITDPAKALKCLTSLARASGASGLVGGEVMDVEGEGVVAEIERVETIHRRKTGALIASSCEMGAVMAGAGPEAAQALYRFGFELGFAFQVVDDVLNETSSSEVLGKSAGSDKDRGKLTYPGLLGIDGSKAVARKALQTALQELQGLPGDLEPLTEIAVSCVEREA